MILYSNIPAGVLTVTVLPFFLPKMALPTGIRWKYDCQNIFFLEADNYIFHIFSGFKIANIDLAAQGHYI